MIRCTPLLCALAAAAPCAAQDVAQQKNHFNDPFFQIAAAIPQCPVPAGPFITEAERQVQAHHRAERGTTCWLAGACDRPNSYAYDQDIAKALQTALAAGNPFAASSLWVTVQGRTVFIEGCVPGPGVAQALEAFVRAVPNVQQAIALVYADLSARPPYKLLNPR